MLRTHASLTFNVGRHPRRARTRGMRGSTGAGVFQLRACADAVALVAARAAADAAVAAADAQQ
jgi:hypothetical protein